MSLGIIVPHLGPSQIAYEAIKLAQEHDSIIFFEQLVAPVVPPGVPTMCVNELMNFRGTLISSNITNTLMAHKLINKNWAKLIFYVWDLEWLRRNKNNYMYNYQAYNIPEVLMCRASHADPLYNYCNRKPVISEFRDVKYK
jgi:hypothetical protein